MIAEIRELFLCTLKDIESQLFENRTARERLEYDWSDKKDASEIDAINCGLNNTSTTVYFKPGATRFMDELTCCEIRLFSQIQIFFLGNQLKNTGNILPKKH